MKQIISALAAGVLFGLGLTISQMINPAKVLAFLDVAGNWDPSLILVMGSGLVTAWIGYRFVLKREEPLFTASFQLPSNVDIDGRLITGAALFGIGWGLAGLCPGPALAALSTGAPQAYLFFLAMAVGMAGYRLAQKTMTPRQSLGADG